MIQLAADEGSSQQTVIPMPLLPIPAILDAIQRLPGQKHNLWQDVRILCCSAYREFCHTGGFRCRP